jgi:hypothetical protein
MVIACAPAANRARRAGRRPRALPAPSLQPLKKPKAAGKDLDDEDKAFLQKKKEVRETGGGAGRSLPAPHEGANRSPASTSLRKPPRSRRSKKRRAPRAALPRSRGPSEGEREGGVSERMSSPGPRPSAGGDVDCLSCRVTGVAVCGGAAATLALRAASAPRGGPRCALLAAAAGFAALAGARAAV